MSPFPRGTCNYGECRDPIMFVVSAKNPERRMVLDPDPVPDGIVVIRDDRAVVLTKAEREAATMFPEDRYNDHHVTCKGVRRPPPPMAHARRSDPATSHEAARDVTGRLRRSQDQVLALLRDIGPCTDITLVAAAHERGIRQSDSGIRTRRKELTVAGLVVAVGTTRIGNRSHTVWAVAK